MFIDLVSFFMSAVLDLRRNNKVLVDFFQGSYVLIVTFFHGFRGRERGEGGQQGIR